MPHVGGVARRLGGKVVHLRGAISTVSMAAAAASALPLKKRQRELPQRAGTLCDSSPAVSPGAGDSSHSDPACAASSTGDAPGDTPVDDPRMGTDLYNEATKVRSLEAKLCNPIADEVQAHSASADRRHATEQCPSPESTTAAAVVLTVDELKERLLQIFTGCGERPTASTGLRSMGAVTVALILNVMAAVTAVMGSHAKPGPHREEMVRCCGDLDNEEARGYLINDAVGRPLLYRDDDRAENHARDVGKRVWNAAAKAEREMAAQKERDATAVRAAKRAAAKDPTKEPAVLDAERARDTSRAATLAAPVELDLPAVTVGSKLTRITHELMCQHQKAAARKAAAEAACRDAELKSDTASRIYLDIGPITLKNADEMQAAVMERVAAAYAFQDAAVAWNEAADACEAAHDSCIRALEAQCEAAQEELTEARSKRQCVMEKAALDALIRCYQDCPWTVEPV